MMLLCDGIRPRNGDGFVELDRHGHEAAYGSVILLVDRPTLHCLDQILDGLCASCGQVRPLAVGAMSKDVLKQLEQGRQEGEVAHKRFDGALLGQIHKDAREERGSGRQSIDADGGEKGAVCGASFGSCSGGELQRDAPCEYFREFSSTAVMLATAAAELGFADSMHQRVARHGVKPGR